MFVPECCKFAQSSGEWPGDKSTLPREFGVLTVAVGIRPPVDEGGPRFGTGPRLGKGPVVGTRIDCEDVGRVRRFEAFRVGGGMSEEAGLAGGPIEAGFGGGAMKAAGEGAEALCAEFNAGKDGGGRLSSSSSSELSWAAKVKVGTSSDASRAETLGVPSGDASVSVFVMSTSVCLVGSSAGCSRSTVGSSDGLRSPGGVAL